MWESVKTVAPTLNSAIIQLDVDDNFVINGTHLNMIRENKFDGYLQADPHDHIREFLTICDMFKYGKTQSEAVKLLIFPFSLCDKAKTWFNELNEESITSWKQMRKAYINRFCLLLEIINEPTQGILDVTAGGIFLNKSPNQAFQFLEDKAMDSQIISLNEELQDIRNKYNELRQGNASKNHLNDDTPMCERHEANYIQSEGNKDRNSHDLFSRKSHHDPNDSEKSLTELNNDVKMISKISKDVSMNQNEKNFQTIFKNMERKMDEWEKSQNISPEHTNRTGPPPPQAHTEHVNTVFIESGKSDDSSKIQKDPPPSIFVNNKNEKEKPIKISKKGYHVVKTKEYPFREYIPKIPYPQALEWIIPT
ncbi:hypothetical protein Tco_0134492 [Tanacetum coccineum]